MDGSNSRPNKILELLQNYNFYFDIAKCYSMLYRTPSADIKYIEVFIFKV